MAPFDALVDDVLQRIFEFVGPNDYWFVGATSRRFRRVYKKTYRRQTTSWRNATESSSRVDLVWEHEYVFYPIEQKKAHPWKLRTFRSWRFRMLCKAAAYFGRWDILKLLFRIHRDPRATRTIKIICGSAAQGGHLNILEWALAHHSSGYDWGFRVCAGAALNEHLEILKWARFHGCWWNERTCLNAVLNGHLHVLKWAVEHGCPQNYCDEFIAAARNGDTRTLQWLWQEVSETQFQAQQRHLRSRGELIWDYAAESGHLNVLQWLLGVTGREMNPRQRESCCLLAVAGGHLHMLEWANEDRDQWDSQWAKHAARKGHVHVLQWALDKGYELNHKSICLVGKWRVLKWAWKNGWNKNARVAKAKDHPKRKHSSGWKSIGKTRNKSSPSCKLGSPRNKSSLLAS